MTLDDRSIREHLDRRANAGVSDRGALADSVNARLAAASRDPWWRRLGSPAPAFGFTAVAAVVLVLAIAVLPQRPWPDPGASPTASPAETQAPDYPATRAMTATELDALLGDNPADRASILVIADVELVDLDITCIGECPAHGIEAPTRTLRVYDPGDRETVIPGPQAFRVRSDGDLDLLGPVRVGPDGLAWTLPRLTAALPDLRGADRAVPYLYLVDAVRAVSSAAYRCLAVPPSDGPDFTCGDGVAWLVPDEASAPSTLITAPADSLRVPNVTAFRLRSDALRQRGFWLVDPFVVQDSCFLCPPAGAADLVGRVLTLEELAYTPSPSPTAFVAALSVEDIAFSNEVVTLDGFETADVNVTVTFAGDVVQYHQMDGSLTPLICLERDGAADAVDPHPSALSRTLVEIGGTNPWVASFRLTSGDRGTWRVTCVVAYDASGNELNINPAITGASPKLEVIGTHAPHLTMEFKSSPAEIGQALEVFGRVTDEDTGDPLEGIVVAIGRGDVCTQGGIGPTVTTNPNGAYTYVIPEADDAAVCTWITDLDGLYPGLISDPIAIYAWLSAHPTEP